MARTKQTARKSTGGFAPRMQLASRSANEMRSFLLNQQAAGTGGGLKKEKKIFVNCENTFGASRFKRSTSNKTFQPNARLGFIQPAGTRGSPDLLMRLDFTSSLDGVLTKSDRQPLDVVFVMDVSGSMGSALPDDSDRRSKLAIAQECMRRIADELKPCDRVGLVAFNHAPTVQYPLSSASGRNVEALKARVSQLYASGGTSLAAGLQGGYDLLLNAPDPEASGFRLRRVVFLTDMESSANDESAVIALARSHANVPVLRHADNPEAAETPSRSSRRKRTLAETVVAPAPIHMTLVGVGVDLSVSAVERISAIPGPRYVSVINAAEFFSTVVEDFNYDVTPIAFDIQLRLPAGLAFERIFGSAELNALQDGATEATVSSEFPVHLDAEGCTNGGLYICKLRMTDQALLAGAQPVPKMIVSWTDPTGTRQTAAVDVCIPDANQVPEEVDIGLRKAAALAEYVQCLTEFATIDNTPAPAASVDDVAVGCSGATATRLLDLRVTGIVACPSAADLPADTPAALLKHYQTVTRFSHVRRRLLEVMATAQDTTLEGSNANVLQTIDQVINLETAEISSLLDKLRARTATTGSADANGAPRGYLCPISLTVMKDPVVAQDGHSYERASIAGWFATGRTTSPVTNLPLASMALAPNHALRAAIQEFLTARTVVQTGGLRRSPRKTVTFKAEKA